MKYKRAPMIKPHHKNNLAAIHALHQSGQLDAAKKGYLALLKQNPRQPDILHALGILSIQQDNTNAAIDYLQKAATLQPANQNIQLHLANALKQQGLFNQAADVLQKTLTQFPDYIAAYNNLGTVYFALGKWDEAIASYKTAIDKQANYVDAYYNLGLAYSKKNAFEDAIRTYKTLLDYAPDHFPARFHLACIYMQQNQLDAAIAEFLIISSVHAYHFETESNLATCYLRLGNLKSARQHYINAIKIHPTDTQLLFNLGYISTQLGDTDQAIQFYQRTVQANPDLFAAHNNVGVAFLAKGHPEFALHHFQEALRIQPNNKTIAYTVQMLSQNQRLLAAPPDYIQSLFDAYADHYETHLMKALDYQIPKDFMGVLSGFIKKSHPLDVLDLGCGTGLCGVGIKPYAKSLIGVDISQNMLDVALQKKLYDQLIQADFMNWLPDHTKAFDLIMAGDVIVYIGDLTTLFQEISRALRDSGLFIFNAEINETDDYKMNQSGRFSHSKRYIETLAKQFAFKIVKYQTSTTRLQNNEPVPGHLFLLQH